MKTTLPSLVLIATAYLVQPTTSFAVPVGANFEPAEAVVEKPLDATGYGFTSHAGKQQIFEDFKLSGEAEIDRVTWYGLFSEGTVAKNQSRGRFDVFLFSNNATSDYLEMFPTPEGTLAKGLPDGPALFAATGIGATSVGTGKSDPLHGGDIKKWTIDIPTLSLAQDGYFVSIRASSSEDGHFLWSHSKNGADGYTVLGATSRLKTPSFSVSSEIYDTQAFALELVNSSLRHQVPDSGPGIAVLLAFAGLLIGSHTSRHRKVA
jgi:hypothetical protein